MIGKPTIPDPETTRALMTGCGSDIDSIMAYGKSRTRKVSAVIEPAQRRVAPEPLNRDPQKSPFYIGYENQARASLTFGRNSTGRKRGSSAT